MAVARFLYRRPGEFVVRLTTDALNTATLTVSEKYGAPEFAGTPILVGNDALKANLAAFGTHRDAASRLTAEEIRRSHRKQADRHRRVAELLAEMLAHPAGTSHVGWCSACFGRRLHRGVSGRGNRRRIFICDGCGSPMVVCSVLGCGNTANASMRPDPTPRFCAEHRHQIPAFDRLGDRLARLEDYAAWLQFDKRNASAISKVAAGVVVVGACVTPVAWASAPFIGGAIGSMSGLSGAAATSSGLAMLGGGSLAAGGAGMAGGMIVVSAVGGALGSAVGATATASYVGSDHSFKIEVLRRGTGPAVVLANGFLTDGTSGWANWKPMIDARYPDSTVYRVHWGSKELKSFATLVGMGGSKHVIRAAATKLAQKASKKAGLGPLGLALGLPDLVANPWHVARNRAEMTGAILADLIARTDEDRFVLIGHSLGGRVMVRAAQILGTKPDIAKIEAMHLLGAAVSRRHDWRTLHTAVTGTVANHHSRNDPVLAYVYRASQGGQTAVGSIGFRTKFAKIRDHDVSANVHGHSEYFTKVKLE